jgi:hypothetical protein
MTATPEVRTTEGGTLIALRAATELGRITQGLALTAINFPTVGEYMTALQGQVIATPVTPIRVTGSTVLVAILVGAEERILRAWTFTQDDHDFYVLQAGAETYVYDKLSEQWAQWSSPDADNYWRGVDGCDWNGINVCIDPDSGKLYEIDAVGRLDYETTPITSYVYGGVTERFRNVKPVYMAEVAISQTQPPLGIDATTLGITLETSDTIDWVNHGTVQASPRGSQTYARYYGLGIVKSPGLLFKITDTGYARRIDGLNVEIGGASDGQ